MPKNSAAWLARRDARLDVRGASYTPPREKQIVVQNHAVAINPFDWIIQAAPGMVSSWIKFPFVLGSDLAGEVVEVGPGVTRFKVGDRVLGHALGVDKKRNNVAESAFQNYTVLLEHMAAPIPDFISYERAAVLPLGLSTAACGLFQKDQLALQHPTLSPTPTGETLLVWGGSTSVGSNAIQLAVAAGYEVFTTASPANFEYVRRLGAAHVVNHNSPSAANELARVLTGKTIAGALAIGPTAASACLDVVHTAEGKKFVSIATFPLDFRKMAEGAAIPAEMIRQSPKLISFLLRSLMKARLRGIQTKAIYGTTLMNNEISGVIYSAFLPNALAERRYIPAPEPMVVGRGLEAIQAGFDLLLRGVSATKVVVTLR